MYKNTRCKRGSNTNMFRLRCLENRFVHQLSVVMEVAAPTLQKLVLSCVDFTFSSNEQLVNRVVQIPFSPTKRFDWKNVWQCGGGDVAASAAASDLCVWFSRPGFRAEDDLHPAGRNGFDRVQLWPWGHGYGCVRMLYKSRGSTRALLVVLSVFKKVMLKQGKQNPEFVFISVGTTRGQGIIRVVVVVVATFF